MKHERSLAYRVSQKEKSLSELTADELAVVAGGVDNKCKKGVISTGSACDPHSRDTDIHCDTQ